MLKFVKMLAVIALVVIMIPYSLSAQDKEILAKIGNKKITMTDLNRIIGSQEPEQQKIIENNPQIKQSIRWNIVQGTVVSDIAKKKGFNKKPEIKNQIELMINNFLTAVYLQKEIVEKITINDDKAHAYYKDHPEIFKTPEKIRVKHILIKVAASASDEEKKKASQKAEEVLIKIKGGEDFSKLASEISDDPGTKEKGGGLDFFSKGTMVPAFEEAAFSLKPGEISGIIETEYGYHIIKMEEKKEALLEPYENIKDKVKDQALQEIRKSAVTEFLEKAVKDARVEVFPERIDKSKK